MASPHVHLALVLFIISCSVCIHGFILDTKENPLHCITAVVIANPGVVRFNTCSEAMSAQQQWQMDAAGHIVLSSNPRYGLGLQNTVASKLGPITYDAKVILVDITQDTRATQTWELSLSEGADSAGYHDIVNKVISNRVIWAPFTSTGSVDTNEVWISARTSNAYKHFFSMSLPTASPPPTQSPTRIPTLPPTRFPTKRPSTPPTSGPPRYQYAGCYEIYQSDFNEAFELLYTDGEGLTVESCISNVLSSSSEPFAFIALNQGRDCFAGNINATATRTSDSACFVECPGDQLESCGGNIAEAHGKLLLLVSIYVDPALLPPTAAPTSVPTSSPSTAPPTGTPAPSLMPTIPPSALPSAVPTASPAPSSPPTMPPSMSPSAPPSMPPSPPPTIPPSMAPTIPATSTPSAAPSSPPTSAPPRYQYAGCYEIFQDDFDEDFEYIYTDYEGMTVESCISNALASSSEPFVFIALNQGGDCYAGNINATATRTSDPTCYEECPGDGSESCGGNIVQVGTKTLLLVTLYADPALPLSPSPPPSVPPTLRPESYSYVGCYQIGESAFENDYEFRTGDFDDMTVEECAEYVLTNSSDGTLPSYLAFVRGFICYSSETDPDTAGSPTEEYHCNDLCSGNYKESCGGDESFDYTGAESVNVAVYVLQ